MARPFHLHDPGILKALSTNMKRRIGKAVAAWEDDGGARRVPPGASAVRSRKHEASRLTEGKPLPLEVKPGDRILFGGTQARGWQPSAGDQPHGSGLAV